MRSRSVRKNVKAFMLSHGININSLSPPSPALSLFLSPSPPLFLLLDCLSVCLRLCARVLATDRRESSRECVLVCVCVCACKCVRVACLLAGRGGGRDSLTEEGREKNQER